MQNVCRIFELKKKALENIYVPRMDSLDGS